jgi:hypothetical protein
MNNKPLFILLLVIISSVTLVNAASLTTNTIYEGKTIIGSNTIELTDGKVAFTDTLSGVTAATITKIDGVEFKPTTSKIVNGGVEWGTGEKSYLFLDDPIVKLGYNYSGNTLKETITLKEDKQLSFILNLSKDSKLVPEIGGRWKIVSIISGNTMAGIILEKPFGIDNKGNLIDMDYTYEKGELTLNYNRTSIIYPLVIDPTWTSSTGFWTSSLNNNLTHLIMWNATGNTTYIPKYFNNMSILIVGGGGSGGQEAGGGGGAGGFINTTINIANGTTYNISVGTGGVYSYTNYTLNDGVNGSNTSFKNATVTWVALGGGAGGGGLPNFTNGCKVAVNGNSGASGGGGAFNGTGGTNNASQGNIGGKGNSTSATCTDEDFSGGGGGGSGAAGQNSQTASHPGDGGNGNQSNITGTLTYYAGGGGGGTPGTNRGYGGNGGGGDGGWGASTAAISGTNGLGGGGGGARWDTTVPISNPGNGGSGVLIISYVHCDPWLNQANFTASTNATNPGVSVLFIDTSIKNVTENQTYFWEFGDGYTSNTVGNVSHVYSWTGLFTVNLTISSETDPTNISRVEWMSITTDTGTTPVNNTRQVSYSPRTVTFKIIDEYNTPKTGVVVDGIIDSYTFPNGAIDLVNFYGMSLEAAQQAVNTSFILHGTTDTLGQVTFTMLSAVKYTVNVTSGGTTFTKYIYPSTDSYIISIPSFIVPTPASNYISYSFNNNSVNNTTEYFNLSYTDTSGGTSSINFTLKNQSGGVIYTTVVSGFGVATTNISSGPVTHAPGDTYTYSFVAPQAQIGNVSVVKTITWQNLKTLGGYPDWVGQWMGIALLVVLAAVFSLISVKYAVIIIPVITWFMTYYMQWINPTLGGSIIVVLGSLVVIGALRYIWEQQKKLG